VYAGTRIGMRSSLSVSVLPAQFIVTRREEICKQKIGKRAARLELLGEDPRIGKIPHKPGKTGVGLRTGQGLTQSSAGYHRCGDC
jgi:hypothetical protein